MQHGYHDATNTLAILSLANQLGFVLEGAYLCMVILYFIRYRKTDSPLLQIIVGTSTILELVGTGLCFLVCWRISSQELHYFPVWETCTTYVVRIPVQVLAQTYFGYRCWSLLSKPKFLKEIWMILLLCELGLGELTLVYSYSRWSLDDPRPWPVGPLFTTQIFFTAILNICVAVVFARALLAMRSPFRRTEKVLYRIILLSFCSNLAIASLTIATALLWFCCVDAKFHIPLELLSKAYPIVLLAACLARDSNQEELRKNSLGLDALGSSELRLDINLDFINLKPSISRAHASPNSSPQSLNFEEKSL